MNAARSINRDTVQLRLAMARELFAAAETGVLPPDLAKRLAPSAGLRNILVHQYADADLSNVATAADRALVDYGEGVRTGARWLSELDTVGGSPAES